MSTIEQELQAATRVKKVNDRQKHLETLVEKSLALPDDRWQQLSPEAHAWVNSNVDAYNKQQPITDFDAASASPDGHPPQGAAGEATDTTETGAADAPPAGTRKRGGAQTRIKELIMGNPTMSVADLRDKIAAEGFGVSSLTVSTIRSDFLHSLRVVKDAGHLGPALSSRL